MTRSILKTAPAFALTLMLNLPLFFTSGLAQDITDESREEGPVEAETLTVETSAELLRLRPRFRGNFDSESGGTDAFISGDAFFPILQQPGRSTFYLYPKLRIDFDDESRVGGNLLFGYRNFSEERDRILGGYVSLDVRDTGESVFPQIGFGFERLGQFDIRANGYIPVGDTKQQTDRFETGFSITNTEFQGRSLQLTAENTIWEESEVALGGFDVEAGGSIFRWNDHGNLELFGGLYYLGGDDVSAVGGRGRLALTPVEGMEFGVGVQGDDVFGTRVFFGVTAHLPDPKAIAPTAEEREAIAAAGDVFARLDDPVARIDSVVVDHQRDVETVVASGPALNPDTGEPWFFTHVTAGGNSDGSVEDPFATVQEGLDATAGEGNDIVFVALGNDIIPAFTIPDGVRVLSAGPQQFIDAQVAGLGDVTLSDVLLPTSGNGDFPLVVGTVTMGNQTVLSGFDIQPQLDVQIDPQPSPGDPGVLAQGVSDFTITNNKINTVDATGIQLNNAIANAEITDNTLSLTSNPFFGSAGIEISQTNADLNGAIISGNTLSVGGGYSSGIVTTAAAYGGGSASINNLTVSGNTISASGGTGAGIATAAYAIDGGSVNINNLTVTGNSVSGNGLNRFTGIGNTAIAINPTGSNRSASTVTGTTISGNTITSKDNESSVGIQIIASARPYEGTAGSTEVTVRQTTITGNTISTNGVEDATGVELNGSILSGAEETSLNSASLTLDGTTIINNSISSGQSSSAGIAINLLSGEGQMVLRETDISRNSIQGSGIYADGILLRGSGNYDAEITVTNSTISGNTITLTEGGGGGAYVEPTYTSAGIAAEFFAAYDSNVIVSKTNISGNEVTTDSTAVSGIEVEAYGAYTGSIDINETTISGNTVTTNGNYSAGIEVVTNTYFASTAINDTRISGNTVTTNGYGSLGIGVFADIYYGSTSIEDTVITGNTVTTNGGYSAGLQVVADAGYAFVEINNTTISGNSVTTNGVDAPGIQVAATSDFYASASINNTTIAGNTVTTNGNGSPGIGVYASSNYGLATIENTVITGNTITTTMEYSDGILIEGGNTSGGGYTYLLNTLITGNTVTTNEYSSGVQVSSDGYSYVGATVSNNIVTVASNSSSFYFNESNGGNICIDLSGNTSNTPDPSSFDLSIVSFTQAVEIVGFTSLPDLSADNNDSLNTINIPGFSPVAGTSGVRTCP
ncbi:MAG: beta strand repeat-containing protein [Synechococcus sp.]